MRGNRAPVYGHVIEPCRVTRAGVWLVASRLVLPFLLGLAVMDLAIWAIARTVFDACYGVWCWF